MASNCKLKLDSNQSGHSLSAMIEGDVTWMAIVSNPGLPLGDANAPVSDSNPIALFQELLGKVTAAMSILNMHDADDDPNVCRFENVDAMGVCIFQQIILHAAESLLGVGVRLAQKKDKSKFFDKTRIQQAWRLAQNAGKKQHGKKAS